MSGLGLVCRMDWTPSIRIRPTTWILPAQTQMARTFCRPHAAITWPLHTMVGALHAGSGPHAASVWLHDILFTLSTTQGPWAGWHGAGAGPDPWAGGWASLLKLYILETKGRILSTNSKKSFGSLRASANYIPPTVPPLSLVVKTWNSSSSKII